MCKKHTLNKLQTFSDPQRYVLSAVLFSCKTYHPEILCFAFLARKEFIYIIISSLANIFEHSLEDKRKNFFQFPTYHRFFHCFFFRLQLGDKKFMLEIFQLIFK